MKQFRRIKCHQFVLEQDESHFVVFMCTEKSGGSEERMWMLSWLTGLHHRLYKR